MLPLEKFKIHSSVETPTRQNVCVFLHACSIRTYTQTSHLTHTHFVIIWQINGWDYATSVFPTKGVTVVAI